MKRLLLFALLTVISVSIYAKKSKDVNKIQNVTIYAYATAINFNDSIAYMTDVIKLDSAFYLPGTKKFLGGRSEYCQQLQNYFHNKGMERRCCTFFYYTKKDKAEKAYVKLRRRIQKKDKLEVQQLSAQEFTFHNERPNEYIVDQTQAPQPPKDKKKKHDRKGPKDGKGRPDGPGPQGGMGGPGGMPGGPGGMPGGMGGPGM